MKGVVDSLSAVNTSQPAKGEVKVAAVQRAKGVVPSNAASQSYQNWAGAIIATQRFERDNVKVGSDEYISKADYEALSNEDKQLMMSLGVTGFSERKQQDFEAANVKLSTNEWIDKTYYQSLTAEDQAFLSANGTTVWNTKVEHRTELLASIPDKYKTGDSYNLTQMLYDGAISAYKDGVHPEVIKELFGDTATGKVDVDNALLTSTLLATLYAQGYADAQGAVYTDKFIADRGVQAYDDLKQYLGFTEAELGPRPTEASMVDIPDPSFVGPVDIDHPAPTISVLATDVRAINATSELQESSAQVSAASEPTYTTVEEIIDAVATNKVSVSNLVSRGVIESKDQSAIQKEADLQAKVNTALTKIDDPKYKNADGSYNLVAILHDDPIPFSDVMLIFGQTQEGRDAIKSASQANAKKTKAELARKYRGVWARGGQASQIAKTYLDFVVPGYATQRHWDSMSAPMKGISIALDIVSIVPILGAAGRGAKAVAVTGRTTRAARVSGAIKGLWTPGEFAKGIGKRELKLPGGMVGELVNQVAWPAHVVGVFERPVAVGLKTVQHPIRMSKVTARAAKQTLRHPLLAANRRLTESALVGTFKSMASGIETAVRPGKLPEVVLTDAFGTVRLAIKDTTSSAEAMKIRDRLMKLAIKGNEPIIEISGKQYKLERAPLMKELGGGASHATPSGDAFEAGFKVTEKPTMPLREQGLFVSHEPLPRFAIGGSAHGGTGSKPAILVFSPEMADSLTFTEKVYTGSAEMELKFKVGFEGGPPKQRLFTRVGELGERVEIFLWKPLTKTQRAKLKAQGLIEQFKTIYSPSLRITDVAPSGKAGLTAARVEELAVVLEDAGSAAEATALRRVAREVRSGRSVANSLRALEVERLRTGTREYSVSVRGRIAANGVETRTEVTRTDRNEGRTSGSRVSTSRTVTPVVRDASVRTTSELPRTPTSRTSSRTGRSEVVRATPVVARIDTPRTDVVIPRVAISRTKTAGKSRTDIIIPWLPSFEGTRKEAKLLLKASIMWRQGKLHDKDIWIVLYPPYQQAVYLFEKPKGVREIAGPKSAYRTAVVLKSPLHHPVQLDIGAFIARIEPSGVGKAKLSFVRDTGNLPAPEGTVVWQQGELHGKPVYIVIQPPYQQDDVKQTMQKPLGATEVSVPKNASVFHGRLSAQPLIQVGAFKVRVSKGRSKKSKPRLTFYRGDSSEVSTTR